MNSYIEYQAKIANETPGTLNEIDGFHCDKCNNKGVFYFEKNGELYSKKCECRKTRKAIRALKDSGLMEAIKVKTFDTYKTENEWQAQIKKSAISYCQNPLGKWFFIGGQSGAGKTHICTAICGEYLRKGIPVRYMIWSEEARRLKANRNNDEAYNNLIEPFKAVDVLYIDDFLKTKSGTEPTPADINVAFEIINARLARKKKTIVSSEYVLDELLLFDEATISRISEEAKYYIFNIDKDPTKNYRIEQNYDFD